MNEDRKIAEAEYFYGQMLAVRETRWHFVFNLSALLTAARSVFQYACEEATAKPGGQKWYDAAVAGHATIKFFRGQRNVNIHVEPVKPETAIGVELTDQVSLGETVEIHLVRDGKTIQQVRVETPPPAADPVPSVVRMEYRFADWKGGEDVIALGRIYLDEFKAIVTDGRAKGFLM